MREFLALEWVSGGGFLGCGIVLSWLLIPARRGEAWAAWATLSTAAAVWVPPLLAVVVGPPAAAAPGEARLVAAAIILLAVTVGAAGLLLKSRLARLLPGIGGGPGRSVLRDQASDGPGRLSGKVALVTGGSRGIGAAIATRLAEDGADVALTYKGSQEEAERLVRRIEQMGRKALAIQADSADPAAVKAAVERTVQGLGAIDILVNNAGMALGRKLGEITADDFDRMIAVNVRSCVVATQEAARQMASGGRIINIGSINSQYASHAGSSLYVMTKAAIAGLTRSLARELAPRAITVNNVMPGPTDTAMNPADGSHSDAVRAAIALRRYAEPHEIADLVAYIATPGASFITGASLAVDGGYSA